MSKKHIHTYDIFDIKDVKINKKYFNFCHKEALRCGMQCRCYIKQPYMKLELWGNKYQFIKYYLNTLSKCSHKMNGVKRLASIIVS